MTKMHYATVRTTSIISESGLNVESYDYATVIRNGTSEFCGIKGRDQILRAQLQLELTTHLER